jgi:hypothetical protein
LAASLICYVLGGHDDSARSRPELKKVLCLASWRLGGKSDLRSAGMATALEVVRNLKNSLLGVSAPWRQI